MPKSLNPVAVDTSVWTSYLRGSFADEILFNALLDYDSIVLPTPVRIELLSGVRKGEIDTLARLLSTLPTLLPTSKTWAFIEKSALTSASKGYHFGFGDLLIAALASEGSCEIWSFDSDFRAMAKLGFVRNLVV